MSSFLRRMPFGAYTSAQTGSVDRNGWITERWHVDSLREGCKEPGLSPSFNCIARSSFTVNPSRANLIEPSKSFAQGSLPCFLCIYSQPRNAPGTATATSCAYANDNSSTHQRRFDRKTGQTESADRGSCGIGGVLVHPQVARPRSSFTEINLCVCQ